MPPQRSRWRGAGLAALALVALVVLCLPSLAACGIDALTGESASDKSTAELVQAVGGDDAEAAREAATVLAERKDPGAVAGLAEIARTQSGGTRRLAFDTLDALGPEASAALIEQLEYEIPDRDRRALKAILAGWARTDKQTVRLLVAGLARKYQHWWADDVLVKAGRRAAAPLAAAMRTEKPSVAMRAACVLARMDDRRAVPCIVDALIADRSYGGSTWTAAEAMESPVVARLVDMSRGGNHSMRATYVLLYWVLGMPSRLSRSDKDKARAAVIAALYRTGDTDLGFAMWEEGDAGLTKGAQDWAHSQGRYFYRQSD